MNQDVTTLVSRLETRTRQLLLQYDELKKQLSQVQQQLTEQREQCLALEQEKHDLQEKYAILKMARLMDMTDDDDIKTARKRLNKMIASVDKCLATLKVQ